MGIVILLLLIYASVIYAFSYDRDSDNADYLIVLGCKLNNNKPTDTLVSRIEKTVSYLERNPDCKVIVSGGITEGNTISEADVMEKLLIEKGIDPSRIIKEDQALDTYENFYYSRKLMEEGKKICFCSCDYHILRSKLMATKNGIKPSSISSRSSIKELLIHMPIEEFFIIKNSIEK